MLGHLVQSSVKDEASISHEGPLISTNAPLSIFQSGYRLDETPFQPMKSSACRRQPLIYLFLPQKPQKILQYLRYLELNAILLS